MSSSDIAVSVRDLRKVYRLYTHPRYRVLDMLGLLRKGAGHGYTEHVALDGINFEVRRGEKIGIIGRNGAGKSTLLKLITQVIRPTSGAIDVRGESQALLQIGSGFHPEFTGRENVRAYLAHLGIGGAAADKAIAEVIDFAELEEYIDQPVKTYSTGMGMRLMFAAATVFTPSLLVIDEILGVGDAYFASKSFERIRAMCAGRHTTLLLVTHDIYGAAKLCDRMVWIDRGVIVADDKSPAVIKAYENAIRVQEEGRLRKKLVDSLKASGAKAQDGETVLVELRAYKNRPQPVPVYFNRVAVMQGDRPLAALRLDDAPETAAAGGSLTTEATCWGPAQDWQGRRARPMLNFGSSFHKVGGMVKLPARWTGLGDDVGLCLEYWADQEVEIEAVVVDEGLREHYLGLLPPAMGTWQSVVLKPAVPDALREVQQASLVGAADRHGSGRLEMTGFDVRDASGQSSLTLRHGEAVQFEMSYRINDPNLRERCQVLLAFHRNGIEDICRIVTGDLLFDASAQPLGRICLSLPALPLAGAEYTMTVVMAREGYFDGDPVQFYSINPDVYACHVRFAGIKVIAENCVSAGTGVVYSGDWSLQVLER